MYEVLAGTLMLPAKFQSDMDEPAHLKPDMPQYSFTSIDFAEVPLLTVTERSRTRWEVLPLSDHPLSSYQVPFIFSETSGLLLDENVYPYVT